MIVRRSLSLSKLKKLLPFSLYSCFHSYTYTTKSVSSSHPSSPFDPQSKPFSLNPTKTLPFYTFLKPFSTQPNISLPVSPFTRDGNYDETTSLSLHICPGCGVPMQNSDPKRPGFFIVPSPKSSNYKASIDKNPVSEEPDVSDSLKRGLLNELIETQNNGNVESSEPKLLERPLVCTRCHSLRNYGKVKDPSVENLLPDFDFDHTVGRRLNLTGGGRTVVLMVVDASDFDGSFPRKVARLVSKTIDENSRAWKEGKSGNVPRVVLVVTKIDLLPSTLSPTGLEYWVRTRARDGGANKLTSVHLVSAMKNWGLKNLVDDVVALAGPRGQVWAIGAQNAGKSTLINAIGKCVGGKVTHLTEAPVPGTTLGILRVEGVLPHNAKLFDTPGLLHPHQITSRLTGEEQRLVHMSKELKPRTYRIKVGHSVHIGGLMRLDIEETTVDSIYVTVWASPLLPLHMGKTEKVDTLLEDHFGHQLQPPVGEGRVSELGNWVKKEFRVSGNWWDSSSVDIAAAGVGWFAIGLKGEAQLGVWTYEGVDVVVRNSLIPHRSHMFEVAGFTVSKIVSKADRSLNKQRRRNQKRSEQKFLAKASSSASSEISAVDAASSEPLPVDEASSEISTVDGASSEAVPSEISTVDAAPSDLSTADMESAEKSTLDSAPSEISTADAALPTISIAGAASADLSSVSAEISTHDAVSAEILTDDSTSAETLKVDAVSNSYP